MDTIDYWKERRGRNKRVNAVFIEQEDEKPEVRPFCGICRYYMVYVKNNGYECPQCGMEYKDETTEPGKLGNRYSKEPMIATARGKKKHSRSDFPAGAHIKEDNEISAADGEEKQLIVNNEDV